MRFYQSTALILLSASLAFSALADDVKITLNGGLTASPSCQTNVQALRTDGIIMLYLNGGDYCNKATLTLNGRSIGTKSLVRLFGTYAGEGVALPEVAGANNYVFTFSGNGRSDRISLAVNKAPIQGPKIDVKINLTDNSYASLDKCGGTVQATKSILGDVTVSFNGIDSCQNGALLSTNGVAPVPAINFRLDFAAGGSAVRTIGSANARPGQKMVYKLWSKPTAEGVVIREHIELTID